VSHPTFWFHYHCRIHDHEFVTIQLDVSQNWWGGCLAWYVQQLQSTK
jgi:hypothetical protein